MVSENKDKKKIITKVIVGTFLTLAAAGFIFSDMQFSSNATDPVIIRVDNEEITRSDILQERNGLIQQLGSVPQNNMIKQQVMLQAIENITLRTAIIAYAKSLGITASDSEIAQMITSINAFKGVDGEFDKILFKKILKNQKISINQFKKNITKNIIQARFTEPLNIEFPVSNEIGQVFNQFADTELSVNMYRFSFNKLPKELKSITNLDDEKLNNLYKEKKSSLKKPALKNIEYVIFDAENLSETIKVTDEMIEQFYKDNQDSLYVDPEQRKILQVIVNDEKEAQKIFSTLNQAQSFINAAQEIGYKIDDIDLGYISKNDLEPSITEQLFNAKLKATIKPIKTDFGYAIYYIEAIKPQKTLSFDNVKNDIKKTLFDKKLSQYLFDIRVKIEDDIAGGATFKEITQKYGSKIITQDNIMNNGDIYLSTVNNNDNNIKSTLNPLIPVDYINDYSVQDEVPIIELENNQFALLKITKFIDERDLTFDEAKEIVRLQYMQNEKQLVLNNIINELKKEKFSNNILKKYNVTTNKYTFKRQEQMPDEISYPEFRDLAFLNENSDPLIRNINNNVTIVDITKISIPSFLPLKNIDNQTDIDDVSNTEDDIENLNQEKIENMTEILQSSFGNLIKAKAINMIKDHVSIESNNKALEQLIAQDQAPIN